MNKDGVVVIHKSNGGVCSARNEGIRHARGQYICFIDNDDEYDSDYCKELIETAKKTNADIIKCGRVNVIVNEEGKILSQREKTYGKYLCCSLAEFKERYVDIKGSEIFTSVWNGLYKVSTLKKARIQFDESVKHGNEDLLFNYKLIPMCSNIAIIPDCLYKHYYRDGHSTSLKFDDSQIDTRIQAVKDEMKIPASNEDRNYIIVEGIRECYRILSFENNKKNRKKQEMKIQDSLSWEANSTLHIIKNRMLTLSEKMELVMLRKKWFELYYFLRRARKEFHNK